MSGGRGRPCRAGLRRLLIVPLTVVAVVGCTTTSDRAILVLDAETSAPERATATEPAATAQTTAPAPTVGTEAAPGGAATVVATLDPATSHVVNDGLCQIRVPNDWSDDGGARGSTPGGHAFSLFGARLATPDAWAQAAALFKTSTGGRTGATVTEGAAFVHVVYADDQGFARRAGFGDRYCDLRVTARGAPIASDEQATWDAIVASLSPADG